MFRVPLILLCGVVALSAADDLDKQIKTVIDAYAIVEANEADPVSSEQAFYQGAIPGLLKKLDPHSVFFDPASSISSARWNRLPRRVSEPLSRCCPAG